MTLQRFAAAEQLASTAQTDQRMLPERKSQVHHSHPQLIFPSLLNTIASFLAMLVIALFILTFIAQPFRIPSASMERTLMVGDFLLVNKSVYGPPGHWRWLMPYEDVSRGSVVVFRFPLDPSEDVVKRVVGLPGDRVYLRNGIVHVNGQRQDEPFAIFEGTYQDAFRDQFPPALYNDPGVDTQWWMQMRRDVRDGQLLISSGHYFVLGDNRNHSRDSRYWGLVPRDSIVGRPFLIYFSIREGSPTDPPALPDDRLGHESNPLDRVVDFARWSRMFRAVR